MINYFVRKIDKRMPLSIEEKKQKKSISNRAYFQKLKQSGKYEDYLKTKKEAYTKKNGLIKFSYILNF